jgi:hypothetical protein
MKQAKHEAKKRQQQQIYIEMSTDPTGIWEVKYANVLHSKWR